MFKKPEAIRTKRSSKVLMPASVPVDSRGNFLDNIRTNTEQYELTDTGVPPTNPYRFLSPISRHKKERNSISQPNIAIETQTTLEEMPRRGISIS